MALPFEFEESVFEQEGGGASRCRGPLASPYSARCCEPEWFCEQLKCWDDIENVSVRKFRGDLAYKQQQFQKALQEYSSCLVYLPPSNTAMRRDIQESQARCLARMGKHKEALRIAEILRTGATNTDHITAILNLQYTIYHLLEDIERIIECLQRLILLHPFHPGTWNLLAEAYMSLGPFPALMSGAGGGMLQNEDLTANGFLPGSSKTAGVSCHQKHSRRKDASLPFSLQRKDSFGSCAECQNVQDSLHTLGKQEVCCTSREEKEEKDIWIYACASFVRARLLFQLMESNQSSFALENNLKAQQEIEDKVMSFGVEADVFSLMTKVCSFTTLNHINLCALLRTTLQRWPEASLRLTEQPPFPAMGEDLVREKLKEDGQGEVKCLSSSALTSIMTASAMEFEKTWFQKLKDRLSQKDGQM